MLITVLIVIAFVAGYILPGVIFGFIPAIFGTLAPGADWSGFPEVPPILSLAFGVGTAAKAGISLIGPSRSESAWGRGAIGEKRTGRVLDAMVRHGASVLHDRRVPGSTGNLDHLVITGAGIFVLDTKHYRGRLEVRGLGAELWINGRNRSKLLDQATRQAQEIRTLLAESGHGTVPVTPALCFVGTEMPLLTPLRIGDVLIGTPKSVRRKIESSRVVLGPDQLVAVSHLLDSGLPSMVPTRDQAAPRPSQVIAHSPTCRGCGQPMLVRTRRKDGVRFYGCSTFPRCRYTRPLEGHF